MSCSCGVMVLVLVVCIVVFSCSVAADQVEQGIIPLDSTLLANATANITQTWFSANSTFALGFFRPARLSAGAILAIWFANISTRTVVWMVNRDAPADSDAYFRLTTAGQFVLYNGSGVVVWRAQSNQLDRSGSAGEFQQSGNLVLRSNKSSGSKIVWQSFDNPTDTLLPGQRFSATSSGLRSSRSSGLDPRTGNFFLTMSNSSNNLEIYSTLTGQSYWNSPQFSLVNSPAGSAFAELNQTGALNIAVNSTLLQSYRASDFRSIPTPQRRLTLNSEGNLAIYSWLQKKSAWVIVWRAFPDACAANGLCGNGICTSPNATDLSQYVCSCPQGFLRNDSQDWTQGCFREIPLTSCNNTNASLAIQMHAFDKVNYLGAASSIGQIASATDCSALCLQDCFCVCASYGLSDQVCWIHTDMHDGAQAGPSQKFTFLLKLAHESRLLQPATKQLHHEGFHSVVAIAPGAGLVATIVLILVARYTFRKREHFRLQKAWSLRQRSGLPIKFSYKELQVATDNFSLKNKLGNGGFGTVFKGVLAGDKSTVAVKKLHSSTSGEGGEEAQFQAEVSTIGLIHHKNIVRLRGFCCEGAHRILVYEYMEKGSLERYLLERSKDSPEHAEPLDWNTRFTIAVGVANGIAYCHEQCRSRIIHCDIKPENVLLQDDFCPKVSDFGLAKLVSKSQTRVVTAIRGTRGFVAPEWVANLPVTVKADVYSYGMLLLELIGWRRNLDMCVTSLHKLYYPHWAFHHLMQGDLLAVATEAHLTPGSFDEDQLKRALEVAFWCIQDESGVRPSMGTVVQMLEGTLPVPEPPPPKVLQIVMHELNDDSIIEVAPDDVDQLYFSSEELYVVHKGAQGARV